MAICIVVDDYLPESTKVAAKMMHELALGFCKKGHKVTVITPGPNLKKDYAVTTLDGIRILKFPSGKIKNVSKIKRAINETLLSYRAWKYLRKEFFENKNDLILYYSPSIFWGPLIKRLKKIWQAPSYLILRDLFPQWAIDNGILRKNSLITKFFQHFERVSYDVADVIGVQSPKNKEWFKRRFPKYNHLQVLFNWAENSPVRSKNSRNRERLGLKDKVVFIYGGNIGHAQDMRNILKLANNLKEFPIAHFVLIGAGDEVDLVKETKINESLTNLTLLEPISQEEFKNLLAEFDVGLFCLNRNHQTHNFPGKVLGYMVQSMPILGCVNPGNDLKEVVECANAGFISFSGDDLAFRENAIKLLDKKLRESMGIYAKKLMDEKFSVEAAVDQLEQFSLKRNRSLEIF
ncbi:glycosyltransferase family 4 protein [Leptospira sp. 201903071]|uniref:glycosyltransferase family 4 protein n=1 Tax=Leptospira ainazelensis TaxID=2810034 RepID=UPI0019657A03|nr:glycosyltransferase family 4 protein [Leptospira ainazelensis]MBM9501979.1 glycosyltransferase family 4 protein [Leptospira ainazelensis]